MTTGCWRGRATVVGAAVSVLVTAAACTDPWRPTTTTTTTSPRPAGTVVATGTEARSGTARAGVPPSEAGPAAAAISSLGASLYRRLAAEKPGENLVFSPLSIEAALAMVRNGAAGETRAQMDRVLGAGSGDTLDRALNALDAALVAHNGPVKGSGGTAEIGLRTSNALWAQDGFVLYAAFLDVLARHYGAGVNVVDFARATEAARTRINAFVSERTNGRIPQVLPPDAVNAETRFVLTNTVWFKAPWQRPFGALGDRPFSRADGTTVSVPTMFGSEGSAGFYGVGYGEGPGWKAGELKYVGGGLSMVVIVPDNLAAFERSLDGPTLTSITGGLTGDLRSVQLPRWKSRTATSLPEQLGALGMPRAFTDAAEFSALSPEPTRIDDVLHEAFIAVDEKGTEAAAATAVIGGPTSVPVPRGTPLVVDRPFLYAIRDVGTGAILFLGRVTDPSKTAT
jgi:serpin B